MSSSSNPESEKKSTKKTIKGRRAILGLRDGRQMETERPITADKRQHVENGVEAQQRLTESWREQHGRPEREDNRA